MRVKLKERVVVQSEKAARAMRRRVQRYLERMHRVGQRQDEKRVHAFRIASRNLLAVYPLFPDKARADRWRKPVKNRIQGLNRLRDLQVMGEHSDSHGAVLMMEILAETGTADAEIGRTGCGGKLKKRLLHSLVVAEQEIRRHPARFEARMKQRAERVYARLTNRLDEADAECPKSLHRLRVAYKDFRYLMIFLGQCDVVKKLDKAALKRWQDILGEIQDDRVASLWMRAHGFGQARALELAARNTGKRFVLRRKRFYRFVDSLMDQLRES